MITNLQSATKARAGQKDASIAGAILQRKCDMYCKKKSLLQRAAVHPGPYSVPPIVHEVLRSPGAPLDAGTRAFMEPRFGHDFSPTGRGRCRSGAGTFTRLWVANS